MKVILLNDINESTTITGTDHIYSKDVKKKIIEQYLKQNDDYIYDNDLIYNEIELCNACAKIKYIYEENNNLYADIEFLDTPSGRFFKKVLNNNFIIRPNGFVTLLDDNKIIDDNTYNFKYWSIEKK